MLRSTMDKEGKNMTASEATKKANLMRLKQVIEEIEATPDDKTLHTLIVELRNLSKKQYPAADEKAGYISSFLKDGIENGIKLVAWNLGKSVIDGITPDYSGKFKEVKSMITETGLQLPGRI